MAPGDRGLKWEGQVLGDRDMAIYILPGGFSSSPTHSLTHDHFFHNQEAFSSFLSFPMHLTIHSMTLSLHSPYIQVAAILNGIRCRTIPL